VETISAFSYRVIPHRVILKLIAVGGCSYLTFGGLRGVPPILSKANYGYT